MVDRLAAWVPYDARLPRSSRMIVEQVLAPVNFWPELRVSRGPELTQLTTTTILERFDHSTSLHSLHLETSHSHIAPLYTC